MAQLLTTIQTQKPLNPKFYPTCRVYKVDWAYMVVPNGDSLDESFCNSFSRQADAEDYAREFMLNGTSFLDSRGNRKMWEYPTKPLPPRDLKTFKHKT